MTPCSPTYHVNNSFVDVVSPSSRWISWLEYHSNDCNLVNLQTAQTANVNYRLRFYQPNIRLYRHIVRSSRFDDVIIGKRLAA